MTPPEAKNIDAYCRARQHLAETFGLAKVKLGGTSHTVDLNPKKRTRGIGLEALHASFMTRIEHEIFDDLLIGNKRLSELMRLAKRKITGSISSPIDMPMLQRIGVASGFSSVAIVSLFVQDEATTQLSASAAMLWSPVPSIGFWLSGIWLSSVGGYLHDDAIVYAAQDWLSWLARFAVFGALATAKVANFAAGVFP